MSGINDLSKQDFAEYKSKLITFNSSDKYLKELDFLNRLLNPVENEIILDFGFGIGTAIKYLTNKHEVKMLGYDVVDYYQSPDIDMITTYEDLLVKKNYFDKIYFLHSFAHIADIKKVLKDLKLLLKINGEIVVITPNLEFDNYYKEKVKNQNYVKDRTVVKHYNQSTLEKIFFECGYSTNCIGQFGNFIENGFINERVFGSFKNI